MALRTAPTATAARSPGVFPYRRQGWSDPSWMLETPVGQTVPTCPDGFQAWQLNAGVQAEDLSCVCSCGAIGGGSCSISASIHVSGCTNAGTTVGYGCSDIQGAAIRGTTTTPANATCGAAVEQTGAGGATWGATATACLPQRVGGGCGANEMCIPASPLLGAQACVFNTISNSCPDGYEPREPLGESTLQDLRSCNIGSCGCTPHPQCDENVRIFELANCDDSAPYVDLQMNGTCLALMTPAASVYVPHRSVQGSCSPVGTPTVVGNVENTSPVFACCAALPP